MLTTETLININYDATTGTAWKLDTVIDTRNYDRDECKPIPGTGDTRSCDCCGKNIDVHAHIYATRLIDGKRKIVARAVVGTGCAKACKVNSGVISVTNKNYWRKPNILGDKYR